MQNNWLELQNPKSEGTLTATHFKGVEDLTQDFQFLIEGDSATELSAKDWLGNGVTLTIHTASQGSRTFHGIVGEFEAGNYNAQKERHYRIILSPWLSALRLIQDCRIFQDMSVPKIFRTLCQEAGFTNIDTSHIDLNSYPKRVYCVQYNETTYDFLHRLLGEEGIYYAYEYAEGKHTLVLYDANSADPAQVTEFKFNRTDLESSDFTSFRPTYCANRPMLVDVESHNLSLKLNDVFTVFPDKDNSPMGYRIYKLHHNFADTTTQTTEPYRNEFVITRKHLYKPPKINKPSMGGAQPATVVGAEGKAIYTNERGCIKVQFPWDRRGQHNEKSSCWLPVGQLVSDNGWGTQFIPRVGDEVIVDFLHDDPDQPVVIGSAYNGANPPIFPTDKTQEAISGYKTQLIGKKGIAGEGHELSFNDSAGKETLTLKSAGDLKFSAKHDLNWTTGGDETITINESELINILKGRGDIQAKSIHIQVGASSLTMDDNGIEFKPAGKLLLKAKNIEGEFPVVRLGDPYACPRITPVLVPHGMNNPITKGSPTFKLDAGLAVARVGDPISCTGETAIITKGADTITVDGQPIAHLQSKVDHGGVMKQGSPMAFVSPREKVNLNIPNIASDTKTKELVITIDAIPYEQKNISQQSDWDYLIGLATAFGHGVKSIGGGLVLGVNEAGDMIGVSGISKMKGAWGANVDLLKFLIKSVKLGVKEINPLYQLLSLIFTTYYQTFPECALKKLFMQAGLGGAYLTGRFAVGKELAKKITSSTMTQILETEAFSELKKKMIVAGVSADTVVGYGISFILLEGLVKESQDAAERLKELNPIIYQELVNQDLIAGYFIVEGTVTKYLVAIQKNQSAPESYTLEAKRRYCN